MTDALALLLLLASLAGGLVLVPFGLPGLWVMVAGIAIYGWLTDFRAIGAGIIGSALALATAAELLEAWVGFRFARRYGGSSPAAWGALLGGLVGAVVGVPIPIAGSVIGGCAGAFAGAALVEYLRAGRAAAALGAGWGALLGRVAATAAKMALGVVIAVVTVGAVIAGR